MNQATHTRTGSSSATRTKGSAPLSASDRRVLHAQWTLAAARRRERARQRTVNPGERDALVAQLRKGRGVTDTLAALADDSDTAKDRVHRALLLRDVLTELDGGTLTIRCLNQRKARRFLSFLETEIAWLENLASGRETPDDPPPLAA